MTSRVLASIGRPRLVGSSLGEPWIMVDTLQENGAIEVRLWRVSEAKELALGILRELVDAKLIHQFSITELGGYPQTNPPQEVVR